MPNKLIILAFLALAICLFKKQDAASSARYHTTIKKERNNDNDTLEVNCDSVYKGKGYKIMIITFDREAEDETVFNAVFILSKLVNGKYKQIFRDSVYNKVQDIRFDDFNNDKVKDIMVMHYSDVRSNWSYYLYLVDLKKDRLKKIRGFEEIKNPTYIPLYDLIDNYVMSGKNWTSFYKIQADSIRDYGITIHDNDDGKYEKEYKKAIKSILTRRRSY